MNDINDDDDGSDNRNTPKRLPGTCCNNRMFVNNSPRIAMSPRMQRRTGFISIEGARGVFERDTPI